MNKTLGILVGGGPAPGLNGVISSAAITAIANGFRVVGLHNGFKYLAEGRSDRFTEFSVENISRIHFQGGSIIGTSRENPTKSPEKMEKTVNSLKKAGITHLLTIGGDDTSFSASQVGLNSDIKVIHVPKTIDNDLPLPEGIPTFGFETAREAGAHIVKTLMEDARTAERWYFIVAMGRSAGYLALGMGKSAGATLTLIPEEFKTKKITFAVFKKLIIGSILKRLLAGKSHGTLVMAEGLIELFDKVEFSDMDHLERDEHGHIRFSEIHFGPLIANMVKKDLKEMGVKVTIVDKNVGYELRCLEPNAFDKEYTRNLGFAAVDQLLKGVSAAMVTIQNNQVVPVYFKDILDPVTKKTKIRTVNLDSFNYKVSQNFMLKLTNQELASSEYIEKLSKFTTFSPAQLNNYFEELRSYLN